jgi:hypothetical protein
VVSRIILRSVLLLLLVLAQQVAVVHLTAHAAQQSSQHGTNHDSSKNCEKCLALAHLGDALGSSAQLPRLALVPHPAPVHVDAPERSLTLHAYRSRAPPAYL